MTRYYVRRIVREVEKRVNPKTEELKPIKVEETNVVETSSDDESDKKQDKSFKKQKTKKQ